MRSALSFLAAATLVCTVIWYVNSTGSRLCCQDVDGEYEKFDRQVQRAASGDISSIRDLYRSYAVAGRSDEARRWALAGALQGDEELTKIYVQMFRNLSDADKAVDEQVIRKNHDNPSAMRLVAALGLSSLD